MSEHEKCVCGQTAECWGVIKDVTWAAECPGKDGNPDVNCWTGPECESVEAAWAAWDRVMRAAREARERAHEDDYLASQQ